MIEAVNSTVANATTSRGITDQISASSVAPVDVVLPALPQGAPNVPQAPYVSPYISVDLNFNKAVLQIRDSETGDVQQQFPTQSRLAQLRRAQDIQERAQVREQALAGSNTPRAQSSDIITIQDVTTAQQASVATSSPQIAVAALSAGAQSGQASSSGVTVFA